MSNILRHLPDVVATYIVFHNMCNVKCAFSSVMPLMGHGFQVSNYMDFLNEA